MSKPFNLNDKYISLKRRRSSLNSSENLSRGYISASSSQGKKLLLRRNNDNINARTKLQSVTSPSISAASFKSISATSRSALSSDVMYCDLLASQKSQDAVRQGMHYVNTKREAG